MRPLLSAAVLLFAAAPALAGGAEEFFLGRPPSVGVVQGGAFGPDGYDYANEMRRGPFVASRATRPRSARHVPRVEPHDGRVRRGDGSSPIVARPYFRP